MTTILQCIYSTNPKCIETIRQELESGNLNPDQPFGDNKRSALCIAASFNRLDLAKLFLSYGADPNYRTMDLETPLIIAAIEDDLDMVKLLLNHGADPTLADDEGETALGWTTDVEILKVLVEAGADINHVNDLGETLLIYFMTDNHEFENEDHFKFIETMLQLGARTDIKREWYISNTEVKEGYSQFPRASSGAVIMTLKERVLNYKDYPGAGDGYRDYNQRLKALFEKTN